MYSKYWAVETLGVVTRLKNPLSGHAVDLVGGYPNGSDEGTLIHVFRTKDVGVSEEQICQPFQFVPVRVIRERYSCV